MDYNENYLKWLNTKNIGSDNRSKLKKMTDDEKRESFYKNIEFGTAGLRGIMGPGCNRINIFTIRKVNVAYAKYLLDNIDNIKSRGVAIAYDNRHNSSTFALESAKIIASFGIKVYIFNELRSTPELSYTIRKLNCGGGIVVTASHNPSNYSGYKVYDENGCQLVNSKVSKLKSFIEEEDYFDYCVSYDKNLIVYLDDEIDLLYLEELKKVRIDNNVDCSKLKVVYTPLHGTGSIINVPLLKRMGCNYILVSEQMTFDPNFSNTKSSNPEELLSYKHAMFYARKNNSDLIIATDPDADRIGINVLHNKEYVFLSGNKTAALLINYIITRKKELSLFQTNNYMVDTIVSSKFASTIAKNNGVDVKTTYTGFKNICNEIFLNEDKSLEFLFGYEESFGYVLKDFVRDKDSHQALIMITEMASYYKEKNMTLIDVLNDLYEEYGYFVEDTINIRLEGASGVKMINNIMDKFRKYDKDCFGEYKFKSRIDFLTGIKNSFDNYTKIDYEPSNVLKYYFDDYNFFALRPSGTEPKLKLYFCIHSDSLLSSNKKLNEIENIIVDFINS